MKHHHLLLVLFGGIVADAWSPSARVFVSSRRNGWVSAKTNNDGGKSSKGRKQQQKVQESTAKQQQRFDAATRQFMFTMTKVSKRAPSGKELLKEVSLSFYPGAKIGVVGANGSGKSTLLRIMAGVDKDIEGLARPLPGASIGFLEQEPSLEGKTVAEAIDPAVAKAKAILEAFNMLSTKLGDDLSADEMARTLADLERVQGDIDAGDLWDLDRRVDRAMEALRCPPRDTKLDVLSGGERRRVALARLLLENHDLLLLDEVRDKGGCFVHPSRGESLDLAPLVLSLPS
jgi:ABC-type uncharacterized transport system fused permease/ATPase subunit